MEFESIGEHRYVVALSPAQWHAIASVKYRKHTLHIVKMIEERRCWLPGNVGQRVFEYVNFVWKREGLPFRLRSDLPRARWNDSEKKIRIQTIEDWYISKYKLF